MPMSVTKKVRESNVKFVLEVKKRPCLYNSALGEYSVRAVVDDAWGQVAQACDETVEECKDKWKNLRTVFVRNRKRRLQGRKAPYYLNHLMQFVVPHIKWPTRGETPNHVTSAGSDDVTDAHSIDVRSQDVEKSEDGSTGVQQGSQAANIRQNSTVILAGKQTQIPGPGSVEKAKTGCTFNTKIERKPNKSQADFKPDFEPERHRKSFLLSLLPEVESMSAPQFRLFRRQVLDAIDNALDLSDHLVANTSSQPDHSFTTTTKLERPCLFHY